MRRILLICSIVLLGLILGAGSTAGCQARPEDGATQPATETSPATRLPPTDAATETPAQVTLEAAPALTPPADIVRQMLGEVDRERALTDLLRLTGEEPICTGARCYTIANRVTGSAGLQWAKDYVYQELVSLGYSVEVKDWSRLPRADQNLIARKPGKVSPEEEIYFVAHIDGVNSKGAERSPAADDNASGVAGLLELARVLSRHTFRNTVVLLFSTGEEQGTQGVESYLDQLSPQQLSAIKYVVNLDMLGYDADRDGVMQLWTGDDPRSMELAQTISGILSAYQLDLAPRIVEGCT